MDYLLWPSGTLNQTTTRQMGPKDPASLRPVASPTTLQNNFVLPLSSPYQNTAPLEKGLGLRVYTMA